MGKSSAIADICRTPVACAALPQTGGSLWESRLSLSRAAEKARQDISGENAVEADGDRDPVEIYRVLFRRHFNYFPPAAARTVEVLRKVSAFCHAEGYDLSVYMTAQMHGCQGWIHTLRDRRGKKLGFQPNMLLGRKALVRYGTYAHASMKRYNQVSSDAFDSATKTGELYRSILAAETAAAEEVWVEQRCGHRLLWASAVARLPDELRVHALRAYRGFQEKVAWAARLEAAVHFANRARTRLADSVGFHFPFDWDQFAGFIRDLCAPIIFV